jgi:hypothetical protein
VRILFLVAALMQTAAPPPAAPIPTVRGDRFQIAVPQGWKTLNEGEFVLLQHSSGASLLIQRIDRTSNIAEYAKRQAERIMSPLGFATLGEPRVFKDSAQEWVQYEILGNRISDPHRILYRVLRRDTGFFETVFEAQEERFEGLLTEAESIGASIQALIQKPPRPRAATTRRR